MALPLYVPFGYITFLVGLLWLFSRHYRSRALRRKPPPPWFPDPHTARDVYVSLLSMDPPPAQPVLVAALIARAMTDVKRIMSLKEAKQAMTNLLQKGQVGDELWERLLMAEKELDVELSEVAAEAEEYSQGWGAVIFSVASEALSATMSAEIAAGRPRSLHQQQHPVAAVSQAKLAMLENIRAAQAKVKAEEEKKIKTPPPSSSAARPKPSESTSSDNAPTLSDSEPDANSSLIKSEPSSASKKKKTKKKKKN
ncbi:hypothetical protein PCANC_21552 [Puccinia coronata f. sp. avenae]|uniref:Translocation protein sec66 n=1 Tax=Puccinia coronata f. sp. avenae TaxID=200324 RepID=A0A2N5S9I1_9BASI|nr:hypothetical protein PCANC_21552 [Puccinia coronata f. sp. avenae]